MTRKIIQLSGPLATIALCDDGTVWEWWTTGQMGGWRPWGRPDVPQPEPVPGRGEETAARIILNAVAEGRIPLSAVNPEALAKAAQAAGEEAMSMPDPDPNNPGGTVRTIGVLAITPPAANAAGTSSQPSAAPKKFPLPEPDEMAGDTPWPRDKKKGGKS